MCVGVSLCYSQIYSIYYVKANVIYRFARDKSDVVKK